MHPNYSFDRYLGANVGTFNMQVPIRPKPKYAVPGKPATGFSIQPSSPAIYSSGGGGGYSYGEDLTSTDLVTPTPGSGSSAGTGITGGVRPKLPKPGTSGTGTTPPKLVLTGTQVTKPLIKATKPKDKPAISTLGWIGIAAGVFILGYAVLKPKKRRPRRR